MLAALAELPPPAVLERRTVPLTFSTSSLYPLYKIPFGGGPPLSLVPLEASGALNRGATWSRDGHIYMAATTGEGLIRVSENGGVLESVAARDEERDERTHRWPHALPDGSAVLFTSDTAESSEYYDDARIEAVRVATGERNVVTEQTSRARYLATGHLVYARGGVLFAAPFAPQRLVTTGSPQVVLQGVATTEASGAAHFAVSDFGDLLYVAGGVTGQDARLAWFDPASNELEPSSLAEGDYLQLSLAPDDRRVALVAGTAQEPDIWIGNLDSETSSRLTFEGGAFNPVWSPDGEWIVYSIGTSGPGAGTGALHRLRSNGSGVPEPLWPDVDATPLAVSPDGRHLLVSRFYRDEDADDLWLLDWTGEREPAPWVESKGAREWMADVSPDGRFVAHVSDISGQPEVYVRPFPGPGGRWQVSLQGGFEPRWSPDGGTLYYRWGGTLFRVPIDSSRGFQAQRPEEVRAGVVETGPNPVTYSVAGDGRLLLIQASSSAVDDRVHLIRGWSRDVAAKFQRDR
jgi:serine/threonine-protein kinase